MMLPTQSAGITRDIYARHAAKPRGAISGLGCSCGCSGGAYRLERPSGPFGPIGLPGQDCAGACWHICMSFGGGPRCLESCLLSCREVSGTLR
jgi:hypothetical protein